MTEERSQLFLLHCFCVYFFSNIGGTFYKKGLLVDTFIDLECFINSPSHFSHLAFLVRFAAVAVPAAAAADLAAAAPAFVAALTAAFLAAALSLALFAAARALASALAWAASRASCSRFISSMRLRMQSQYPWLSKVSTQTQQKGTPQRQVMRLHPTDRSMSSAQVGHLRVACLTHLDDRKEKGIE